MSDETPQIVIPSNPSDRKKLRVMLEEMTHCFRRMDDEKTSVKDITDAIKDQFSIAPKFSKKLAKTMYENNFPTIDAEHSELQALYHTIVESSEERE